MKKTTPTKPPIKIKQSGPGIDLEFIVWATILIWAFYQLLKP